MPLYEFTCPKCDTNYEQIFKSEERPSEVFCMADGCDGMAEYRVGKPAMFRVKFDNGGRIGYKIDAGDGKTQYRSATREKYEHTIGNRSASDLAKMTSTEKSSSVFTKEYDRVVRDKEKAVLDKANREYKQIMKGDKT